MDQDEAMGLLPVSGSRFSRKGIRIGFCISSKVACVIMVWHFAVLLVYKSLYNFDTYVQVESDSKVTYLSIILFSTIAVFSPQCFHRLLGY